MDFRTGAGIFPLSVAGNGTLIYGSYLSDEENIPASAARVALFDTIAAILAALVIIPAMATTGAKLDQGVRDSSSSTSRTSSAQCRAVR